MSAELTTAADRTVYSGGERQVHALNGDLLANEYVNEARVVVEGDDDEGFLPAGDRTLREYGSSTRFTFTRASLDVSGFAEDESVTAYAKPDAILLVSNEADDRGGLDERVRVTLDVANVPESVAATLDSYDASIVPSSVEVSASGTLAFEVALPSEFDEIAERDVRPFGDSTSFTIPPDALDVAGLAEGDFVDVFAAEGAVLIVGSGP
ncbi:hypothetical protein HrrHc1_255 [Halorubrum phage Hardycor1]|nr:hypothetical protein HrrHc1_255 [Halorubrum phage Hardycor1]